ncbi:Aste57867_25531 [Aphanomyces stellatus]|uniref:Aste57867_25531 protein n=1 Tax=Aphanomyces stellatus TaxID=120398 RepID=A0A485LTA7_9STRA|nr:hypothetical protein As57867_025452 [Aphanomyces stellatus]VFU02154.1 Aste57867_25531 [Aphanomyces stellatus]
MRCSCLHETIRLVLSTKYDSCGTCTEDFQTETWRYACTSCDGALCVECGQWHGSAVLDPCLLVVLDTFQGIGTSNGATMLEQVAAVLRTNQREITAMVKVVENVRATNNIEWRSLNAMRSALEREKNAIAKEVEVLSEQFTRLNTELVQTTQRMSEAKTQLEQFKVARAEAGEKAKKKRNGHHIWMGLTVVTAVVFWPAAIVAGANAVGTHGDLKDLEKVHSQLESQCANLSNEQVRLQATKQELAHSRNTTTTRQTQTKIRFDGVEDSMQVLRRQTEDLDRFGVNLNKMKHDIGTALVKIQAVMNSAGNESAVARALEASANQAHGTFAVAWKGVDEITKRLKQSRITITDDF